MALEDFRVSKVFSWLYCFFTYFRFRSFSRSFFRKSLLARRIRWSSDNACGGVRNIVVGEVRDSGFRELGCFGYRRGKK